MKEDVIKDLKELGLGAIGVFVILLSLCGDGAFIIRLVALIFGVIVVKDVIKNKEVSDL